MANPDYTDEIWKAVPVRITLLLAMLALAGCAPRLAFSNEAGGVINRTGSLGNDRAYALAENHCQQFGKVARIAGRNLLTNTQRFDCVAR